VWCLRNNDIARRKQRLKHGANLVGDELHESRIAMAVPSEELLVNDAWAALALEDPQAAEVVQMRFFVGIPSGFVIRHSDLAIEVCSIQQSRSEDW